MNSINLNGINELSPNELKQINGGVLIGLCICLFALGLATGLCIGSLVQRR